MTHPAKPRKTPGRVRLVNRVFPPASGATGLYLAELADALADRGWAVEVVTGPAPDAPLHETRPSGVSVRRLPGVTLRRASLAARAAGYAALWPRLVRAAARPAPDGRQPDVVVLKTDPPLLVAAGPWLARRTGAAIVHWAQDLYPDVAVALGVLPAPAARPLRALARRSLRRADAVVAIGRCMAERLAAAGVAPDRLHVVPNWAPAGVGPDPAARAAFRDAHGLDGRFVVMYSGNLGLAHPFEAVLGAAERLADARPEALVLFVGDGPRRAWVEAEVARRALPNVRLLPPQPSGALAGSLGAADLHLVTMEAGLDGLVVPSKLYGALAVGRPVLFLGPPESEAARVVAERRAGTVLPPDASAADVARAVEHWAAHPAEAGRRAARPDDPHPAHAFEAVLTRVMESRRT